MGNLIEVIGIKEENCINCHQCIAVCPVKVCSDGSGDVVKFNDELCIGCGRCIEACIKSHGGIVEKSARVPIDDSQEFINDLKDKNIVALVAPSAQCNFDLKKLIKALKVLGVKAVYDVSLGAEITVACYHQIIEELSQNTARLLSAFFQSVDTAFNGLEGLDKYRGARYDLVITDINMPLMNGVRMAREIKTTNPGQIIVVISAHDETSYLLELINLGVEYFVLKPLDINQFLIALDKAVKLSRFHRLEEEYKRNLEKTVAQRTQELSEALTTVNELTIEVMHRLSAAAELRDTDTGMHNKRLGLYTPLLAKELGMSADFCASLAFAAPLHDIGKISIVDNILLKPGPLSEEEFEIMKSHTITGASILADSKHERIRMIESIAFTHHERWDGSGYPRGLKGEEIPIEGRIVAICDQYDALRSKRPYKEPFSHFRTLEIITKGDGRTRPEFFDPRVLQAFINVNDKFDEIFLNNS